MLSFVRRRFTYANVALTFALVFAMSGGALAASKFLITSTKQVKPSVLASLKGKAGASGAQGPAGVQGAQGPAGAAGAKGDNGAAGANGTNGEPGKEGASGTSGKNGKTVVAAAEGKGVNCPEGGSSFEVEGSGAKHYACNGSPWTPNNTLPPKATERGVWSTRGLSPVEERVYPEISFPIPLGGAEGKGEGVDREIHVHFIQFEEKAPVGCTGGSNVDPIAEPGNLCIYATETLEAKIIQATGPEPDEPQLTQMQNAGGVGEGRLVGTTGALLVVHEEGPGAEALGDWAVTEKEEA